MGVYRKEIVGTKVKQILSYNPQRRQAVIINMSTSMVYISDRQVNVKEEGIPLGPFLSIRYDLRDGDNVEALLYAVCEAEGCELRIYEAVIPG